MSIIIFVPPDFETTWEVVETPEPDEMGFIYWGDVDLPEEPPENTVSIFRVPDCYESFVARTGTGTLYMWDDESGATRENYEWQKITTPTANIKTTAAQIEKLVAAAKANIAEAVRLARENGIRLYLQDNIFTPNIEVNGDCWETSAC